MALSNIENVRLHIYIGQVGRMTVDEALSFAIEGETMAKLLGPFDPAFAKFKNDECYFFEYASLLEKE